MSGIMEKLFKGFVPVDENKNTCVEWSKEENLDTSLSSLKCHSYVAGVLRDNIICVDVDDIIEAKRLLDIVKKENVKTVVYQRRRGYHFFFYNDKNTGIPKTSQNNELLCGIDKTDLIVSNHLIMVLDAKSQRNRLYPKSDVKSEDIELQEIPVWLYPFRMYNYKRGVSEKNYMPSVRKDILGLKEHEGRNVAMFNVVNTLATVINNVDKIRQVCRIINNHMFAKPLPEVEMKTLLSDKRFSELKNIRWDEESKSMVKELRTNGDYDVTMSIIEKYKVIDDDGKIEFFINDTYTSEDKKIKRAIMNELKVHKNAKKVYQILETIKIMSPDKYEDKTYNDSYFRVGNGIINWRTGEFIPGNTSTRCRIELDYNYNPDVYSPEIEDYLNEFVDGDLNKKQLLLEMAAYTLIPNCKKEKIFWLTGRPGCGKSRFARFITGLHKKEFVSSLSLQDFDSDTHRFSLSSLEKSSVCFLDNTPDISLNTNIVATMDKISSGIDILVEEKGVNVRNITPFCKMIITSNYNPRTDERQIKESGWGRRIVVIPCLHQYYGTKECDEDFDSRISTKENYEYLLKILVGLLPLLNKKNGFTKLYNPEDYNDYQNYKRTIDKNIKNDSFEKWWSWNTLDINGHKTKEIYANYLEFCHNNNYKLYLNLSWFSNNMKKKGYNIKTIKDRTTNKSANFFELTKTKITDMEKCTQKEQHIINETFKKNEETCSEDPETMIEQHSFNVIEIRGRLNEIIETRDVNKVIELYDYISTCSDVFSEEEALDKLRYILEKRGLTDLYELFMKGTQNEQ